MAGISSRNEPLTSEPIREKDVKPPATVQVWADALLPTISMEATRIAVINFFIVRMI